MFEWIALCIKMLKPFRLNLYICYCSTRHSSKEQVKFTNTINLPRTKFPSRLTADKREVLEKNFIEGTFAKAYRYQEIYKDGPAFILHDGPPYANGDLHMGHAVNKILKDITLRQRVANGQKVHYVPGWDCHGLPIELKAMSSTLEASKNHDTTSIREASRKFAANAVARQREELRAWGILADWSNVHNIYLTNNPSFITHQLQLFLNFYHKGLVFRDLKPVYWSPSSGTALAEAELEYDRNFISPSIFVRFKLNAIPDKLHCNLNNGEIIYGLVWTTTPWTLPSNQAICYNADLEYSVVKLYKGDEAQEHELYILATNLIDDFKNSTLMTCSVVQTVQGSELQNCTYQHPIHENLRSLPFFAASHVEDSKGTGLVHTAPAHGPDDFLVSLSKKLPVLSYVDDKGLYNDDAPAFLRGKEVLTEGNALVMKHIAADIVFSGSYTHSYPIDWRTKKPVIIRASKQWFINTDKLKDQALKEIENVEIYPRINSETNKKSLVTQIQKRPYWCISRQRVWGVPIPVFYNRETNEVVTNDKIIAHICKLTEQEGSIDFWWSKSVDELLTVELLSELNTTSAMLVKGTDIFDIWFDSGSSWASVLKEGQIADLYLEGIDQFTGWFQSSMLTSVAARNCAPYRSLFVHGFAVDKNGHKMSKSLGNVISPKEMRQKFGVDALRWFVASHGSQNTSVTVSNHLLQQAEGNIIKMRAILRYLNGVIGNKCKRIDQNTHQQLYLNKYMLSSLTAFEQDIQESYDAYEYNRVVAKIQHFVANQISAIYVHLIKDRLYCGSNEDLQNIRYTLAKCYEVLCKVLWPIVPFLVEETWSYYDSDHAFHEQNIKSERCWQNEDVEQVIQCALNLKHLIKQKAQKTNTWKLDVLLAVKHETDLKTILKLHPRVGDSLSDSELCEILQIGRLMVTTADKENLNDDFEIHFQIIDSNICPRCRRFSVKSTEDVCDRCSNVLQ